MNVRWIATLILKLVVSSGLLLFVFSLAPIGRVGDAVGSADLGLVLLGSATFLLLHYVSAWKLYYLIAPQRIPASVARLFVINLTSHFYACVLPVGAAAGAFARWYKLSVIGGQRAQAFASIVMNRLLELLTISGIGLLSWGIDQNPGRLALAGGFIAVVFGLCVVIYALTLSVRFLAFSQGLVDRSKHVVPSVAARVGKIVAALSCYPRLTVMQHSRLMVLSLVRNLVGVLALYLLCTAIGIQLSPVTVAWVRSATVLLTFAPLSMLGLGIREASFLYLLQPHFVPEPSAVALGLLYLAANLGVAAIGGIIEMQALIARWVSTHQRSLT